MSEIMDNAPMAMASEPTKANRTGAWRFEKPVFVERIAPCSEACPLGEDIPGIMSLISNGDFEKAYHTVRKENPFPGICGRTCYHPCETVCNRKRLDEAVSIRDLEWFVSNVARELGMSPERQERNTTRSVAVVGGEPAGIACAYFLALLGYEVTIIEQDPSFQGLASLAKPQEGLTTDFIRWELEQVLHLGINIETNMPAEPGFFQNLGRQFEAVYFSSGALHGIIDSKRMKTTLDVYLAQDLFRRINSSNAPVLSGQVAIVGGGTRALESARAVKNSGGHPVIVYSGGKHDLAYKAVQAEEKEGIEILFGTGALGLIEESGKVKGLICSKMKSSEPARIGQQKSQLSGEAPFQIQADQVIIALGQKGNLAVMPGRIQESGLVIIDQDQIPGTANKSLDKKTIDPSRAIVRDIACGKGAALSLDLYFRHMPFDVVERFVIGRLKSLSMEAYQKELHEGLATQNMGQVVSFEELNLAYFEKAPRVIPASISNTFRKKQALISARRCFKCGSCTFCYVCYDFCPDLAIHMDSDARYREIDYDYCKGCGICVEECPRGAISWAKG
ncbi:MAG: 4Fe-4S binding protein [Deltaproteobacteria bacterium]|nr:4Fe-4S binding protein [Deltaproteobacteria bacterium]